MTETRKAAILLAACLGCAAVSAEVLNALALGAKNDGSADVSAIVNANTEKGALFFPAGIYKVADIFTVAKTGACEGTLALDCGAAWRFSAVKGASGKVEFTATPSNALCEGREIKAVEEEGILKVFVLSPDATPMSARFTTSYMCAYFRPLDHASLRTKAGQTRHRDVRATLGERPGCEQIV